MSTEPARKQCFVARPITVHEADRYGGDTHHWDHVEQVLLRPAIEEAGYECVPPAAAGAQVIHSTIIRNLNECSLVVADFSLLNPNVLFEAGIRTAINKPLVLVAETGTVLPFDTNIINTFFYDPRLQSWDLKGEVGRLHKHISDTLTKGGSEPGNELWTHFGVALRAGELKTDLSPTAARVELLSEHLERTEANMVTLIRQLMSHLDETALTAGPLRKLDPQKNYRAEALRFGRRAFTAAMENTDPTAAMEHADKILAALSLLEDSLLEDDKEAIFLKENLRMALQVVESHPALAKKGTLPPSKAMGSKESRRLETER